jgi:hypothetical protein
MFRGDEMTNREWLNSLADGDLTLWLCDSMPILVNGLIMGYTGLDSVKFSYSNSILGINQWLGEEYCGLAEPIEGK